MLNEIWKFLKNPVYEEDPNTDSRYRKSIFFKLLGLSLGISLLLSFLTLIPEDLFKIDFGKHAMDKAIEDYTPIFLFFAAVVLAPLIEETIFRGPLYFFRNFRFFSLIFYLTVLIFGFYHITNFEINRTILLFSPLLVAPQLSAGIFFGFIRVRFGLIWSMALHACYNLILVGPVVLLKILNIPVE